MTGIVLAGGHSRRLGRNKAREYFGERMLIERVVGTLSPLCRDILLVSSEEQYDAIASINLNVRVVVDLYPGKAAFGGLYTGLVYSTEPHGLVVACDMPFLNGKLLSYLVGLTDDFDLIVPVVEGLREPLHAVYAKKCLPYIKKLLDEGELQMLKLFDLVKTLYVPEEEINKYDPQHLSFININTPQDMEKAIHILERLET